MSHPDRNRSDTSISGTTFGRALDKSLSILGSPAKQAVFEDLERAGIVFSEMTRYSLEQIRQHLYGIFGEDAAELLLERLRGHIEKE